MITDPDSGKCRPRKATAWAELYAQWLRYQAQSADIDAGHKPPPDNEDGERRSAEEAALVREMAATRVTLGWQIAQKISVLEQTIMPDSAIWADKRDWLLLASLRDDVLSME